MSVRTAPSISHSPLSSRSASATIAARAVSGTRAASSGGKTEVNRRPGSASAVVSGSSAAVCPGST